MSYAPNNCELSISPNISIYMGLGLVRDCAIQNKRTVYKNKTLEGQNNQFKRYN